MGTLNSDITGRYSDVASYSNMALGSGILISHFERYLLDKDNNSVLINISLWDAEKNEIIDIYLDKFDDDTVRGLIKGIKEQANGIIECLNNFSMPLYK